MPTPIGHIAAGALLFAAGKHSWRRQAGLALAVLFFALLPDIDLVPGLLLAGNANAWHHQATHSLVFVVFAGWSGGLLMGEKGRYTPLFITAGMLHLGLDLLARDTSAPFGAPLFWPFWSGYIISPLQIFSDVHRSGEAASFLPSLFNGHNMRTVGIELSVLTPCWGVWYLYTRFRKKEL
jgi:membrane-bound metal-dependent hydrolase YbcI (DUF457 family)